MNCFRRVLTRCEKKAGNYEALLHLAYGIIVKNKVLLRGFKSDMQDTLPSMMISILLYMFQLKIITF
uniref:Uncharacterized protein n=1 Tax=Klebsiella pneumoniae TaxID=573 RepID=A0A486VZB2_KLEPN|nr:Uncharacterised protein [Klebsiella pneumoniae]